MQIQTIFQIYLLISLIIGAGLFFKSQTIGDLKFSLLMSFSWPLILLVLIICSIKNLFNK